MIPLGPGSNSEMNLELYPVHIQNYGGIFRTYIVNFYYIVHTTFAFRRSLLLFYYLMRTTFSFLRSFGFFLLSRAHGFVILYIVFFSFLLSLVHDFFSVCPTLYINRRNLTQENESISLEHEKKKKITQPMKKKSCTSDSRKYK